MYSTRNSYRRRSSRSSRNTSSNANRRRRPPVKIIETGRGLYAEGDRMLKNTCQVDASRLDEVDFEDLDRHFDLDTKTLFRIGPTNNDYFQFGDVEVDEMGVLPEDDDVFLTQTEVEHLFPHRYGIDPESIKDNRDYFFKHRRLRKQQAPLPPPQPKKRPAPPPPRPPSPPQPDSPPLFSPYVSISSVGSGPISDSF